VPDLSHLWQRFMLACALLFGLALGVGATVFGYSNTATVKLSWSVFHLPGVPLWTVALVPLAVFLVAGTAYHWLNSLHHFTEHMRHRRRVRELEAELTSLRAHLDELLGMPDQPAPKVPTNGAVDETVPVATTAAPVAALPEAVAANGHDGGAKKSRKRASLTTASEPETVAVATDKAVEREPLESNPDA
jgi:hypothetical protein